MTDDVGRYLELVRAAATNEREAVQVVAGHRDELTRRSRGRDAEVAEALGHLATKRLLASNTLKARSPDERLRWDAANRWLHELVSRDEVPRWTIRELALLNGVVVGGATAIRREPVFAPPEQYLEPARIAPELAKLEAYLGATPEPAAPLLAAVVYITVVTIHPFDDGNGRTARLAADRFLLAGGWLPLCFLSPITGHVAQMQGGRPRDPARSLSRVLDAVGESYRTVLRRLTPR